LGEVLTDGVTGVICTEDTRPSGYLCSTCRDIQR
jgi:hypothetical protein